MTATVEIPHVDVLVTLWSVAELVHQSATQRIFAKVEEML